MNKIEANINNIKNTIINFKDSLLFDKNLEIIAVTKNQTPQNIEAAILAGITNFGENYVQEAMTKWLKLKQKYPHIKLHLIGHLQRNKVKEALALFDVIQTIDNQRLIEVIIKELNKDSKNIITKSFFIQINLDEEETINDNTSTPSKRSGIAISNFNNLINFCKIHKLNIEGIMAILPNNDLNYPYFAFLKNLQKIHSLKHLSMGMTNDFPQAVQFGASFIRIGTAIFKN